MAAVEIVNAATTYTSSADLLNTAITVLVLLYFLIYKARYRCFLTIT